MKRPYRVGALGAGLAAVALLAAGCGTGGVASAGQPPDTQSGQQLFTASCGSCHTLAAAGSTGTVGPNLDQLKPSTSVVAHQVMVGGGAMPAFQGKLTPAQIQAVAQYVSSSAGK